MLSCFVGRAADRQLNCMLAGAILLDAAKGTNAVCCSFVSTDDAGFAPAFVRLCLSACVILPDRVVLVVQIRTPLRHQHCQRIVVSTESGVRRSSEKPCNGLAAVVCRSSNEPANEDGREKD